MNSNFFNNITNSNATYEPFLQTWGYVTPSSMFPHYVQELQSSSVTDNGFLWWKTLARMTTGHSFKISPATPTTNELSQDTSQSEKKHALIQLLRSWREGNEQEQQNTWEYLKQALDEDRTSERKLFP